MTAVTAVLQVVRAVCAVGLAAAVLTLAAASIQHALALRPTPVRAYAPRHSLGRH